MRRLRKFSNAASFPLAMDHLPAGCGVLTRRDVLDRAARLGAVAMVASAVPVARGMSLPAPAAAVSLPLEDASLQAFADTMIPGRRIARTESGRPVHDGAIAGADGRPGAVETDALVLYRHPGMGFDTLAPPFLADLNGRSLEQGRPFLQLAFDERVAVCLAGLDHGNPSRVVWEAAAAVAFTAFCAAGANERQTATAAAGYRVMGLPGAVPNGYRRASYGKRLGRERTRSGNLP